MTHKTREPFKLYMIGVIEMVHWNLMGYPPPLAIRDKRFSNNCQIWLSIRLQVWLMINRLLTLVDHFFFLLCLDINHLTIEISHDTVFILQFIIYICKTTTMHETSQIEVAQMLNNIIGSRNTIFLSIILLDLFNQVLLS